MAPAAVNAAAMDFDDPPSHPDDPLAALVRQDLDRLSIVELDARVAALEAEVARCRRRIEGAVNHRASADALFGR